MAWKSTTFKKEVGAGAKKTQVISQVVSKHKEAMGGVIHDAKLLADEQRRTLERIQDPRLKRSAAI